MKYQHHIQLNTAEQLPGASAVLWYQTVKEFGPDDITYTYQHNGNWVAMEYGTAEGEEFPHQLVVPLERDLTPEEAMFIVEAWTQMAGDSDFDIEASNQYRQQGFGNFQNSLDIQPEITEQVSYDMSKFNHNRWVANKINEGWRWGSHCVVQLDSRQRVEVKVESFEADAQDRRQREETRSYRWG